MYNKMSSFESASSDGDLCQPVCDPDPYYEANGGSYYTQLYPADSQNAGTQVITIMEEEGYWGSPCSSTNESQQTDAASLGPAHAAHHRSSAAVSTIRLLTGSHLASLPPPSCGDPSPSSCSSSSSSPSTSSSVSSSVYGHQQQRHQLQPSLIGGYPCLRSPDADADQHHHPHHPSHHHHQQQQQQQHPHPHPHHHQPSPVYDCPMVYEKNVNAYIPDEGYYGGGNGTPMHVTSGGGTVLSMTGTTTSDHQTSSSASSSSSAASSSSSSALLSSTVEAAVPGNGLPIVRVVKRRNTANKKERRRTQSINSAYTSLRDRIPNVPNDTKLSKIKTLRLAISYIAHLLAVVNGNQDPSCDFRAELVPSSRKINAERRAQKSLLQSFPSNNGLATGGEGRKIKGRTGWPQHVWALETKTSIK